MNKIKSEKVGYLSLINEQRGDINVVSCRGCVRAGDRMVLISRFSFYMKWLKKKRQGSQWKSLPAWSESKQAAEGQWIVLTIYSEVLFGSVAISTPNEIIVSHFRKPFHYYWWQTQAEKWPRLYNIQNIFAVNSGRFGLIHQLNRLS